MRREDAMGQPEPREAAPGQAPAEDERLIDRMVEETFPASDATQLPGRAAGAPDATGSAGHKDAGAAADATPRTIGNQGVLPASRHLHETVALGDAGEVMLRLDGDLRRMHLSVSRDAMALDANALDRLIAALSAKRVQMPH
jgi:hypothetical protein